MPGYYYCATNEHGFRLDRDSRPELKYGMYDINAPQIMQTQRNKNHNFVFAVDTSLHAFESGFLHHTLSSIKSCLESVLYPETTNIGLVTYDSTIHFFSLPLDESAEPTILNVGDINNPFVPLPFTKLMLNVASDKSRLESLIDKVYNSYTQDYYSQSRTAHNSAVGAVLKACVDLLSADGKLSTNALTNVGGRIMVFSSFIANCGVGAVINVCNP